MLDVASGEVVGMHVAASAVENGRKRAVAIALGRFLPELPAHLTEGHPITYE